MAREVANIALVSYGEPNPFHSFFLATPLCHIFSSLMDYYQIYLSIYYIEVISLSTAPVGKGMNERGRDPFTPSLPRNRRKMPQPLSIYFKRSVRHSPSCLSIAALSFQPFAYKETDNETTHVNCK